MPGGRVGDEFPQLVEIDLTKAMGLRLRMRFQRNQDSLLGVEIDLTKAMGLRPHILSQRHRFAVPMRVEIDLTKAMGLRQRQNDNQDNLNAAAWK